MLVLRVPNATHSHCERSIHNTYMFASGWRLVGDIIRDLIDEGLDDTMVKAQLKSSPALRTRFLVLYDTVNVLVQAGQANFAILASASSEYRHRHGARTR